MVMNEGCSSTRLQEVCVGQTSAKGTPKYVLEWFRQVNIKGTGSVYPTMHAIEVEHFGIIILGACNPEDAN